MGLVAHAHRLKHFQIDLAANLACHIFTVPSATIRAAIAILYLSIRENPLELRL